MRANEHAMQLEVDAKAKLAALDARIEKVKELFA
jgi:hypothetical protein